MVRERLADAPAAAIAREALAGMDDAWVVGGAVRDALLDRPVTDFDLAVRGDAADAARALARAADAHPFELSGERGMWRVQSRDGTWHVDIATLRGDTIEADLGERDFTLNAIAAPLAGGELVDPHGGIADTEGRVLHAVGERSFESDPLRIVRAARLGASLELQLDPRTVELARACAARAGEPAGERQLAELREILIGPDPVRGLELLDELGATAGVLPELELMRGVGQNPYHQHDVHGHTLEVVRQTAALLRDLDEVLGERAPAVAAVLAEPLGDEMSRGDALMFAALLHDIGKPETRAVAPNGRVLFIGHDEAGVRIIGGVCARLRASRRLTAYLKSLTRNHLRLGFLVHERPLSRRQVYEYLVATEPESVDVTLLTVADRLATRGPRSRTEAIESHLELALEMIDEGLLWRSEGRPVPPIRGDELAAELGIEPGPWLGRALAAIEEAQFAGEVGDRAGAIELARRTLPDLE